MEESPGTDWQTWAALAVVAITILAFILRARRKKTSGGGCDSCK